MQLLGASVFTKHKQKVLHIAPGNKTMTGSWMTTGHVCRQIQQLTPQSEACDKRQIIDKLLGTPPQNSCDQAGAKLISYTHNISAETCTWATNRRELGGVLPFEYKDLVEFRSRSPLKRERKSEGIAVPQTKKPDTFTHIQRDVSGRCYLLFDCQESLKKYIPTSTVTEFKLSLLLVNRLYRHLANESRLSPPMKHGCCQQTTQTGIGEPRPHQWRNTLKLRRIICFLWMPWVFIYFFTHCLVFQYLFFLVIYLSICTLIHHAFCCWKIYLWILCNKGKISIMGCVLSFYLLFLQYHGLSNSSSSNSIYILYIVDLLYIMLA